jgi:putative endonuclease
MADKPSRPPPTHGPSKEGHGRSKEARRAALKRGQSAEWLALVFLMLKGWRPLARRYGGKGGEIDLIVVRGDTVAFVEVKARASHEETAIAITPEKKRLFARLVRTWLARNPWAMTQTLRADAIFMVPWRWPVHITDAFTLEGM